MFSPRGGFLYQKSLGVSTVDEYFTSSLYPIATEDSLTTGVPSLVSGTLLLHPTMLENLYTGVPSLVSGELVTTIAYLSTTSSSTDNYLSTGVPSLVSGELVTTIAYLSTTSSSTDNYLSTGVPSLVSGTLT